METTRTFTDNAYLKKKQLQQHDQKQKTQRKETQYVFSASCGFIEIKTSEQRTEPKPPVYTSTDKVEEGSKGFIATDMNAAGTLEARLHLIITTRA